MNSRRARRMSAGDIRQYLAPFRPMTDADRLQSAVAQIPQLAAAGPMHQLPPGLEVTRCVERDMIAAAVLRDKGEALCAHGLSTDVVLAAQGLTAYGDAAIGLARYSTRYRANDAVNAMRRVMGALRVQRYTTMVLGGEMSRDPARPGSVANAIALAAVTRHDKTLVCGRVGVHQMTQAFVDEAKLGARALPPWPGIPAAPLYAILTIENLYYGTEDNDGPFLEEDRLVSVGLPLSAVLDPLH